MIGREGNIIAAKFVDGEIIENLKKLMEETNAKSAIILNGIGQLENTIIGYFNGNDYVKKEIKKPVELVSLQGNIGFGNGGYIIHAHASLGTEDHSIIGGHLIKGDVKVVNEIFLYILDEIKIRRVRKEKLMEMVIS